MVLDLIVALAIYERRSRGHGTEIAWDEVVGLIVFCWMLFGWGFAIVAWIFFGASLAGILFRIWFVSAIAIYLTLRLP